MIDVTNKDALNSQPFDVVRYRLYFWGPTADVVRAIEADKGNNDEDGDTEPN